MTFDSATGTVTLASEPSHAIQAGENFMVDATILTRTHTSTPDQYIDAIAVDYSTPPDAQGINTVIYVGARAHGNNVVNFWRGDQIAAHPGGQGFLNGFTGTVGDIQQSWIGKYRDEGHRSTILAATYVAEYAASGDFGSGQNFGPTDRSNPNHDFWPNQNGGWPNRNTTGIGARMHVDAGGRLVVFGTGRTVQTTAGAYQRNLRPVISGARMSAVHSASSFTAENMIGANLNLTHCRVRWNNQVRTVTAFDNETGEFTLATPFDSVPPVDASFAVDEGVGNWGNFVRVYSEDLSMLEYSTLFSSAVNPVDGTGTGGNTRIFSALPLRSGRLLVTGFHNNATGNPIPTANAPAWGAEAPTPETSTAVLGVLHLDGALSPEILTQPASASRTVGDSVSFTVEAEGRIEGGGALSYQWTRNHEALDGAISPTLTLGNLVLAQAGSYRVGVTQDGLTTWSDAAVLSISGQVPTVHEWPVAGTLLLGQTLGGAPLSGGSASVPGQFAFVNPDFAPEIGTALHDMVFLPADADSQEPVFGTVSVTVQAPPPPPGTKGVYRINFTDAVTASDSHSYGGEIWQRVNLQGNSSSGEFLPRNFDNQPLTSTTGLSGGVSFSATASYTTAHTGAMQNPAETLFPATGHGDNARFDWFDASNPELRKAHSYDANNRSWTFTFAGFAPEDEVSFQFVQRRTATNRNATLRYLPAGEPDQVLYIDLNIGDNGNAVYHSVTLSGAESYSFRLGPNGGWTGLFNAVSVTILDQELDPFAQWLAAHADALPGGATGDTEINHGGVMMKIRDIFIAGLDPAADERFEMTGLDASGMPVFGVKDGRQYRIWWTDDLMTAPGEWNVLKDFHEGAPADAPGNGRVFYRLEVRLNDE